jgi:hypothetical protein
MGLWLRQTDYFVTINQVSHGGDCKTLGSVDS